MGFTDIFSTIFYIKSYFPSNTLMLATFGLGTLVYKGSVLALPIIKPFFITNFKPIIVGIVSMGNVIPMMNHIAKKQDVHQELLGTLTLGQYEHTQKILNKIEDLKSIYMEKTTEIINAFNIFVEKQLSLFSSLENKISALTERVEKLGLGFNILADKVKNLKASAGPEKLTYHKEDDFQNGASSLLNDLNSNKDKLNFKEKLICGEKESYIEEIYNSLIKKPTSIIVNMVTGNETENLITEEDPLESLQKEFAKPIEKTELNLEGIKPVSLDFNLSEEKKAEIEKDVEQELKPYRDKVSSVVEENKEILAATAPEIIEQSFSQEERVVLKKLSSDQQYSNLFVTKSMLSVVCNSTLGIGFSSMVISMGLSSLTFYGINKGLNIPTFAPEDSPALSKLVSGLLSNGSLLILSTVFIPKVNQQLKKIGHSVQEDLEKNTLYEGGLTKAQLEEKLLEEGYKKENISFIENGEDPSLPLLNFVKLLVNQRGGENAVLVVKNAYSSTKQNFPQISAVENLSGGINKTPSIKETAIEIINNSQ